MNLLALALMGVVVGAAGSEILRFRSAGMVQTIRESAQKFAKSIMPKGSKTSKDSADAPDVPDTAEEVVPVETVAVAEEAPVVAEVAEEMAEEEVAEANADEAPEKKASEQ